MAHLFAKTLLGALTLTSTLHELGYEPHEREHEWDGIFVRPLKIVEEKLQHLSERHFNTDMVRYVTGVHASAASTAFFPVYAVSDASSTIVANNSLLPIIR